MDRDAIKITTVSFPGISQWIIDRSKNDAHGSLS